jgi:inner membrane protein involved in colicin E2 resistance
MFMFYLLLESLDKSTGTCWIWLQADFIPIYPVLLFFNSILRLGTKEEKVLIGREVL